MGNPKRRETEYAGKAGFAYSYVDCDGAQAKFQVVQLSGFRPTETNEVSALRNENHIFVLGICQTFFPSDERT